MNNISNSQEISNDNWRITINFQKTKPRKPRSDTKQGINQAASPFPKNTEDKGISPRTATPPQSAVPKQTKRKNSNPDSPKKRNKMNLRIKTMKQE